MNWILPLLFVSLFGVSNSLEPAFSTDVTVENHVITSVNDKAAEEVRLYKTLDANTIGENAFDGCAFTSLMISSSITAINASFPETLETINFTGDATNLKVEIPNNVTVNFYACDEGFINYWYEFIRPGINGTICNVTKDHYRQMKLLYSQLNEYDRNIVVNTDDGGSKIANGIGFLDNYFSDSSQSTVKEKEISQSVMITLILIIASFGMTSIGLFYILKDKNVIK